MAAKIVAAVLTAILLTGSNSKVLKFPLHRTNQLLNKAVDVDKNYKSELKGKPGLGYFLDIAIGSPQQKLSVLIDTGSSNFAVAASPHEFLDQYFDTSKSSTFEDRQRTVEVPYTQGKWQAFLGSDVTTLGSGDAALTVTAEVACITHSEHFFINGSQWQGILGLGYKDIAQPDSSVEPYFDSLLAQTQVNNSFSLQLCGTIDTHNETDVDMGGTLVIGGLDETLFKGVMQYVPIHKEWYYEVVITDISVGGESLNMDCKEYNFDKTIVDSGTTNLRLPVNVFTRVVDDIKRKVQVDNIPNEFWTRAEQLCWNEGRSPFHLFPNLTLSLLRTHNSSVDLRITPVQYLRAVPEQYGRTGNDCYKFAIDSSTTGSVVGAVIIEGFYVVFDREHRQLGFAQTTCHQRSDQFVPTVGEPYPTYKNLLDCAYQRPKNRTSSLLIAAYVMAGICGLCVIPLIIMFAQWVHYKIRRKLRQRSGPSVIDDTSLETADVNDLLPEIPESAEEQTDTNTTR